ncbi:MAG: hypothetical protein IMZ44_24050, partial [Planctomycetes bacterium]|nr:hypothetical protein [Planctomycetota bacterium]
DEFILHGGATLKSNGAALVLGYINPATDTNYLAYPTLKGAGPTDVPVITLGGDINFRSGIKMDTASTSGKADINVTAGGNVQFTRDLVTGVGGIGVGNDAPSIDVIRNLDIGDGGTATIYNSHAVLEQTTLNGGSLVFDPGTGNTITYAGTVSQTGGTMHALSGTTDLSTTIVAGSAPPPVATLSGLVNRWSFNETGGAGTALVDSVGGQNGAIVNVGANDADVGTTYGGQAYLTGGAGASSDYVSLPAGLISGLTDMTIEMWATQESVQNYSRIFDFGSDTTNILLMCWTTGTNISQDTVQMKVANTANNLTNSMAPYTLDQQFHIVMTLDDDGGPSGETQIKVYKDGVYKGTLNTAYNLSDIVDTNNWLGHSKFTADSTANASYNEFRIYDRELSDAEILTSLTAGPGGYGPILRVDSGAELKLGGFSGMDAAIVFGTLNAGAGTGPADARNITVGAAAAPGSFTAGATSANSLDVANGTATMTTLTGTGTDPSLNVGATGALTATGAATNIDRTTIAGTATVGSLAAAGTNRTASVAKNATLNVTGAAGVSGLASLDVLGIVNASAGPVAGGATTVGISTVAAGVATGSLTAVGGTADSLALKNGTANYGANALNVTGAITIGTAAAPAIYYDYPAAVMANNPLFYYRFEESSPTQPVQDETGT